MSGDNQATRKRTAGIGLGNIKKPVAQANQWQHFQAAQRQRLEDFIAYLKTHSYRTYTVSTYQQMQEHWLIYITYSSPVDFQFRQHIKRFDSGADIEIQSTVSTTDAMPIDIVSLPFTNSGAAIRQTMTRKFFLFIVFYIIVLLALLLLIWQFVLHRVNPSRYATLF